MQVSKVYTDLCKLQGAATYMSYVKLQYLYTCVRRSRLLGALPCRSEPFVILIYCIPFGWQQRMLKGRWYEQDALIDITLFTASILNMLGPLIQEIVTYLSPVEAVATEINFFNLWKKWAWSLNFSVVQRLNCSCAFLICWFLQFREFISIPWSLSRRVLISWLSVDPGCKWDI